MVAKDGRHLRLIEPVRERLEASGVPWVIENVPGAPIRSDLILCGSMFGLEVKRHRWFETSPRLAPFTLCCDHSRPITGVYGHPHGKGGAWTTNPVTYFENVPHFSTDIAAAWTVVNRLIARDGWTFGLDTLGDRDDEGLWRAWFDVGQQAHFAEAASAPLAICHAALAALDATTPDPAPITKSAVSGAPHPEQEHAR